MEYKNTRDCILKTFALEGIHGFYKGMVPNVCRSVPAVGISYVVYEKARDFLSRYFWLSCVYL